MGEWNKHAIMCAHVIVGVFLPFYFDASILTLLQSELSSIKAIDIVSTATIHCKIAYISVYI